MPYPAGARKSATEPAKFTHMVPVLVLAAIIVLGGFLGLIFYCLVHNGNRRVEYRLKRPGNLIWTLI
jgi:hypothetical protein